MVAGVNDRGPVGAGEDVGGGEGTEGAQDGGLRAQGHLLALAEDTCTEDTRRLSRGPRRRGNVPSRCQRGAHT